MSLIAISLIALSLSAGVAELDLEADQALRILADDPPIADVQRAALDHYSVSKDDLSAMRTAARLKALLPVLSGSFTQQDNKSLGAGWELLYQDTYPYPDNPYTRNDVNNTGRTLAASATWALGSLIFDGSQIDTYGLVSIHENVLTEITRLYYTRQHNILALAIDPPKDPRTKAALMLRTREIEAMLDALTGGAWTRMRKGQK